MEPRKTRHSSMRLVVIPKRLSNGAQERRRRTPSILRRNSSHKSRSSDGSFADMMIEASKLLDSSTLQASSQEFVPNNSSDTSLNTAMSSPIHADSWKQKGGDLILAKMRGAMPITPLPRMVSS
mmetsp:Transcript_12688/g.51206  ORF Transcript_12688/g.51206 Transcript_12688/m.51206 type:complete len:124 (-) Transcript_12688:819-1190(-)